MIICKYPNEVLKKKAVSIEHGDPDTKDIFNAMQRCLVEMDGLGIAAPQIGISKRMIIVNCGLMRELISQRNLDYIECEELDSGVELYKMINPVITWQSEEMSTNQEGCLSLPNVYANVERANEVVVEFFDENFQKTSLKASGILAVCIQHEIDHLEGKLFIDRLSDLKRKIILDKYNNLMKKAKEQ